MARLFAPPAHGFVDPLLRTSAHVERRAQLPLPGHGNVLVSPGQHFTVLKLLPSRCWCSRHGGGGRDVSNTTPSGLIRARTIGNFVVRALHWRDRVADAAIEYEYRDAEYA